MRNARGAKSFSLINKRKRDRRLQFIFLIFSLLILVTAMVFAVSKIGQNQDNRQQAWDGLDPYAPEVSPTISTNGTFDFSACAGVMTEECGQYLDNCSGCHEAGVTCEGCGDYEELVSECDGLSGLFGSGGDACALVEEESDPVVTEAPTEFTNGTFDFSACAGVMTEECGQYLDNCSGCHEAGVTCEGCGDYEELVSECDGLSGLFGGGGDDCALVEESDPVVTEAPINAMVPTEATQRNSSTTSVNAPPTMTAEPTPTEVPEDTFRIKTKIYLLNLMENL
jgi:hypothetical protein